jgi:hypothetical protein
VDWHFDESIKHAPLCSVRVAASSEAANCPCSATFTLGRLSVSQEGNFLTKPRPVTKKLSKRILRSVAAYDNICAALLMTIRPALYNEVIVLQGLG